MGCVRPYYRPAGRYDTIICTLILNALSRKNRDGERGLVERGEEFEPLPWRLNTKCWASASGS
jgi:hypothetical protein